MNRSLNPPSVGGFLSLITSVDAICSTGSTGCAGCAGCGGRDPFRDNSLLVEQFLSLFLSCLIGLLVPDSDHGKV